jgi:hypothetical protein
MLHVCRKCEFLVDGSIYDFCQNCGAREWVSASSWPLRAPAVPIKTSPAPEHHIDISKTAQGCAIFVIYAGLIAGSLLALWLVVAIIHWMWNHS